MMRSFSLSEIARILGVADPGAEVVCKGVSTDTRTLGPGELFVALRGERFDGHAWLADAKKAGAVAAVVEEVQPEAGLPQIEVPDSIEALGLLARANRRLSGARIVAVTGSAGKTTVKEMLASILRECGPTLATKGNLNNHIGVPLTLFELSPEHRFGVIELGASAMGEIAYTVGLAEPDVALITNAGDAHLEGFGSYDNIVLGKGEIIDGVPGDGTVVLNANDPAMPKWRDRAGSRRVVTVGETDAAQWSVQSVTPLEASDQLIISAPGSRQLETELCLPGAHNRVNALLAAAAAEALGASQTAIENGLAKVKPVNGRLQIGVLSPGISLIDDSYNANPDSLRAALAVLAERPGRHVAVLGTMAELGEDSAGLHRQAGENARLNGVDCLIAVGEAAEDYCRGFGDGGVVCRDHEEAVRALLPELTGEVTVLVKGSRSSAMENVVRALVKRVGRECFSG